MLRRGALVRRSVGVQGSKQVNPACANIVRSHRAMRSQLPFDSDPLLNTHSVLSIELAVNCRGITLLLRKRD